MKPSYSPEMERAVLGAVLLRPEALKNLWLSEEDFCDQRHRFIWNAFGKLTEEDGVPVDLRTLQATLEEQGHLEQVGGIAYLAGLDVDLPDLSGLSTYAATLRKRRTYRELVTAMGRATNAISCGAEDVEEQIANVRQAAKAAEKEAGDDIELIRLADVKPERVSFLWHPRIPRGKLTLLEGDPGQGKSFISAALATAGSLGRGLPGVAEEFEPFKTVFFTVEDGLADTLRPRLDRMRADLCWIYAHDEAIDLSSADGLRKMERQVKKHRPALVVIDPISVYVGAKTDIHRANEVRAVLAPLAKMAERTSCAVLAIRHLAKGRNSRPILAGLGSIDFSAAARSILLAGSNGSNPSERAVVHVKSNLAATGRALAYDIDETGQFFWKGDSELTAADLLTSETSADGGAFVEAKAFLQVVLQDGPKPAKDVKREAREAGISERTLERAKRSAGVVSERCGGIAKKGSWEWKLP